MDKREHAEHDGESQALTRRSFPFARLIGRVRNGMRRSTEYIAEYVVESRVRRHNVRATRGMFPDYIWLHPRPISRESKSRNSMGHPPFGGG
jgi:hypothetical protein